MQAIVSLVGIEPDTLTSQVWSAMVSWFDVTKHPLPVLHMSWQVAEEFDELPVREFIEHLADNWIAFEIHTTGFGIFTGRKPVLHLPIIKSSEMAEKQKTIWEFCNFHSNGRNPFYAPQVWHPHLTLLHDTNNETSMIDLVSQFVHLDTKLTFTINNLAMIYTDGINQGTQYQHQLKGVDN